MSKQIVKRIQKPWGYELIWASTDQYVGKILHINSGEKLSLQYHQQKIETIFLFSGRMIFVYENTGGELKEMELKTGDAYHIEAGRKHRMMALEDCEIFEVSTPQLNDVVRLEDQYGRTNGE